MIMMRKLEVYLKGEFSIMYMEGCRKFKMWIRHRTCTAKRNENKAFLIMKNGAIEPSAWVCKVDGYLYFIAERYLQIHETWMSGLKI